MKKRKHQNKSRRYQRNARVRYGLDAFDYANPLDGQCLVFDHEKNQTVRLHTIPFRTQGDR